MNEYREYDYDERITYVKTELMPNAIRLWAYSVLIWIFLLSIVLIIIYDMSLQLYFAFVILGVIGTIVIVIGLELMELLFLFLFKSPWDGENFEVSGKIIAVNLLVTIVILFMMWIIMRQIAAYLLDIY